MFSVGKRNFQLPQGAVWQPRQASSLSSINIAEIGQNFVFDQKFLQALRLFMPYASGNLVSETFLDLGTFFGLILAHLLTLNASQSLSRLFYL